MMVSVIYELLHSRNASSEVMTDTQSIMMGAGISALIKALNTSWECVYSVPSLGLSRFMKKFSGFLKYSAIYTATNRTGKLIKILRMNSPSIGRTSHIACRECPAAVGYL